MATGNTETLDDLIALLPNVADQHAPSSPLYGFLSRIAKSEAERLFSGETSKASLQGPLQDLVFPFHRMGNITSLHLFGLDELIIFSFYWTNRRRYRKTLDLGANIGLHSIAMSKCGYQVRAFEPDPETFKVLSRNLDINRAQTVEPMNAAVSTSTGQMEFVRILGNLTGNHLAGAKSGSYGDLQTIQVKVEEFRPLLRWADLAKIDVEGHEKDLVLSTESPDWDRCDALLEVGTESNAEAIFSHFKKIGVNMFAQKKNWQPVSELSQMPFSYRDGTLFISKKASMPWSAI